MKDIMVDIETFGTSAGSMIVSIGAVRFDLTTGKTGEEFYTNINAESCSEYGLTADGSTINFWLEQPVETQQSLFKQPRVPLPEALENFTLFYGEPKETNLWGNGCCFDNMLMRAAYKAVGMEEPWSFRNDRDVRTLVQLGTLAGFHQKDIIPRKGIHHHGLDDAKHQVAYCSAIWEKLKLGNIK